MTTQLTLTHAEAASLLRAERTRATGQLVAAKRELRAAQAAVEKLESRLAEIAAGEEVLAEGLPRRRG